MTQNWNPSQTNATATLSPDNLTATDPANGAVYLPGFAIVSVSAELKYWETLLTFGNGSTAVGIGNTSSSFATGQWTGIGADTIGIWGSGIWNNGANVGTGYGGSSSQSNVLICHAYDGINKLYYYRLGVGPTGWVGSATGADPATQTNGFAVPSNVTAHPVVPAFCIFDSTDTVVARFAQPSWTGVVPAGFGSFDLVVTSSPISIWLYPAGA